MLVCADLHLGLRMNNTPLIPGVVGRISLHTYATLQRLHDICNYAQENNIERIAILGDIFSLTVSRYKHFRGPLCVA